MKVLFLIDSLEGYGAEKSIVQIALNFEKITPVFVHFYPADKLKSSLLNAGIKVYSLNSSEFKKTVELLLPIIQNEGPDIIHSTLFRSDMIARRIKRFFPYLILVGSFVSNSYSRERYSRLSLLSKTKLFTTQIRDRITATEVDHFICNSHAIKATNMKALEIPEKKITVIYRGRGINNPRPGKEVLAELKDKLKLNDGKIFLNISRLIKSKGQLDLLKSFKLLIDEYPKNKLLIVGEGPLRQKMEEDIRILDLEKNVLLLGYREDIPELLSISDFFVFPSYFEGLPGVLIEAIIAKKPSIVSDIPENRECFSNEGALFFPPGDINVLYLKLKEAIKLKDWDKRVKNSYEFAASHFDIKNQSKEYERFYKQIHFDLHNN